MFNESRKAGYIQEKSGLSLSKGFLENIFSKTEVFEKRLQLDVSEWSSTDIINFYKYLDKTCLETLMNIHSQLLNYVYWCIDNGMIDSVQNHFSEITTEMLAKCLNEIKFERSIISERELRIGLNKLERDSDKFIILGLFEGLLGKEMCEICDATTANLKEGDILVTAEGRELQISSRLRNYMLSAAEETETIAVRGGKEVTVALVGDPHQVIKNSAWVKVDTPARKHARVFRRIVAVVDLMDMPGITPKQILESGRLNMISQIMRENDITAEDFFYKDDYKPRRNEMEYRYGEIQSYKRYMSKYREYL